MGRSENSVAWLRTSLSRLARSSVGPWHWIQAGGLRGPRILATPSRMRRRGDETGVGSSTQDTCIVLAESRLAGERHLRSALCRTVDGSMSGPVTQRRAGMVPVERLQVCLTRLSRLPGSHHSSRDTLDRSPNSIANDDLGPFRPRHSGLLEDSRRTGVRPDSVQVSGGFALFWAAHSPVRVWLDSGLQPPGTADEAWLKRGLPSS